MVASKVRFEDVKGLTPSSLELLHAHGFCFATPVQAATIPLFAGNKDVAVDACTGSGKTLAFVLPLVTKLSNVDEPLLPSQVGAIIVSPTRELAKQIHEVAQPFLNTVPGIHSRLLVGGTDPSEDVAALKAGGAHVLVGTPGRLADIIRRYATLDFRRFEVLVLDEADRLLDMGFREQLDAIMARLPKQRRTGLFSATQTEAVEALARAGLRNPVRINVAVSQSNRSTAADEQSGQKTPSTLAIGYMVCDITAKLGQLIAFLLEHREEKSIVYFLTCACVDLIATVLARLPQTAQLALYPLHGRMKQAAREATLAQFASQPAGCLLATDVAARGLDIPDVGWVVQYDPPQDPSAFVHRVGRTARMGRSGSALCFLLPTEVPYVDFLRLRKVPLLEMQSAPDPGGITDAVRAEAEADREVLEKGTKAFVSFVRGYKEHHCRFIFRVADLDLGLLGMSFGLLRMPRMPEIKHAAVSLRNFQPSPVDPDTVKFKDKQREKQRQATLKTKALQASQSGNKAASNRSNTAAVDKKLPAAKRRLKELHQDADDMAHEYAMLKKLKKKKLSEEQYDQLTGLAEDTANLKASKEGEPSEVNRGTALSKKHKKRLSKAQRRHAQM